jgi:hypothetical protein
MNQSGFSLLQVLFASSVLGALSLQGLKMMQEQEQLALLSTQSYEINYIMNEIGEVLKDPSSCRATLRGLTSTQTPSINSIAHAFQDYQTGQESKIELYHTYQSSQRSYGQDSLRIYRYELNRDPENTLLVNLKIVFDRLSPGMLNRYLPRELALSTVFDESEQLVTCSLVIESSSDPYWTSKVHEGKTLLGPTNQSSLVIGRNDTGARVVLDGPLRALSQEAPSSVCNTQEQGSMIYVQSMDDYLICDGSRWKPLSDHHVGLDQFQDFQLSSPSNTTTSTQANFCVLHEFHSSSGQSRCEILPPERQEQLDRLPGRWAMNLVVNPNTDQARCAYRCYR